MRWTFHITNISLASHSEHKKLVLRGDWSPPYHAKLCSRFLLLPPTGLVSSDATEVLVTEAVAVAKPGTAGVVQRATIPALH